MSLPWSHCDRSFSVRTVAKVKMTRAIPELGVHAFLGRSEVQRATLKVVRSDIVAISCWGRGSPSIVQCLQMWMCADEHARSLGSYE